jgi:putative copper resistance protein D
MNLEAWAAMLRFTHVGASLFLLGALAFPLYARCDPLSRPAKRILALVALCAGVAWVGAMALNVAGSAGVPDADWLRALFIATGFGRAWLLHLLLTALLAALVGRFGVLGVAVSAAQAASMALFGHSAALEGWQGGAVMAAHAAHVLGAGVWMGGALSLWLCLRESGDAAGVIVRRFSRVGYVAVAAVALGGVVNLRLVAGAWRPDPSIHYGALMAAKIALAATILALAAFNRMFASKPGRRKLLMGMIVAEHAVFLAVLLLAALVSAQSPRG